MLEFIENRSLYFYYVCARDRFVLPTLEIVDQNTYLYRTLRENGYERIVFAVCNGETLYFETYDRLSEYTFRHAAEFERFQGTPQAFLAQYSTRSSEPAAGRFGRDCFSGPGSRDYAGRASETGCVRMKDPRVSNRKMFQSVFDLKILPCMQSEKIRTALVFPEEAFGYFSDRDIRDALRKMISGDAGYRRGRSIMVFTLQNEYRLVQDWLQEHSFYETVCSSLVQGDVPEYKNRESATKALEGLESALGSSLLLGREVGLDEAGRLLERAAAFDGFLPLGIEQDRAAKILAAYLRERLKPGERSRSPLAERYPYDVNSPVFTFSRSLSDDPKALAQTLKQAEDRERAEEQALYRQMQDTNGFSQLEQYFKENILPRAGAAAGWEPEDPLSLSRFEAKRLGNGSPLNFNLVLMGGPGTGKTTLARQYGKMLAANGLLEIGHVVEVDKAALKAQYVGQSSAKLLQKADEADQGVLFIDEVYQLGGDDDFHGADSFQRDIMDALLKIAWDRRGTMAVVIAGYRDKTEKLLEEYEGLASRFPKTVEIADYTAGQLTGIFRKKALGAGIRLSTDLDKELDAFLESWYNERIGDPKREWANIRTLEAEFFEPIQAAWLRAEAVKAALEPADLPPELKGFWERRDKRSDPWEELRDMVGLGNVKKKVEELLAYMQMGIHPEMNSAKVSQNLIFLGNPGTGKTEVARRMGRIMRKIGASRTGQVKVLEADSVLTGDAIKRASKACQEALGGILFVDEAYLLGQSDIGVQVLQKIMKFMEDHAGEVMVIFAGYEKEIQELLKVNPGLSSRFTDWIVFEDYTAAELRQIAAGMAAGNKYGASADFLERSEQLFQRWLQGKKRDFGNAREVRKYVNRCIQRHAVRMSQLSAAGVAVDADPNRWTLTADDLSSEDLRRLESGPVPSGFETPSGLRTARESFERIRRASESAAPLLDRWTEQLCEQAVLYLKIRTADGEGTGTAFLASPEGDAVTCAHCVRNAVELTVRVGLPGEGGQWCPCQVLFSDEKEDLAVIRLERGEHYPFLPMASSGVQLQKGQPVSMLGFPKGLTGDIVLYDGKIASLSQNTHRGGEVVCLQIEGKHGNSGSPVQTEDHQVCGVFQGSFGKTGDEVNFMSPVRNFWRLAEQLWRD